VHEPELLEPDRGVGSDDGVPLGIAAVGVGDRVQRTDRINVEWLVGVDEPVQRFALGLGEQPATRPQAVHRPVVVDDVVVHPDTTVGQGVGEIGQGGGEPGERPPERGWVR
jgi:hypothetical protein